MTAVCQQNEPVVQARPLDAVRVLVLFGGSHLFGQERADIDGETGLSYPVGDIGGLAGSLYRACIPFTQRFLV